MSIPRIEHPKPQFQRSTWLNLNGTWQFEIDHGNSGQERNLHLPETALSSEIIVPFCPESRLSGIGYKDFMSSVWYKRQIHVTAQQLEGRVFLHFGAVDYLCNVYVNGQLAGTHKGGYTSFRFEITSLLNEGENQITVNAQDNTRDGMIPSGKQSPRYDSHRCYYTRTTGIWQTVWLEYTPKNYIKSVRYAPSPATGSVTLTADLEGKGNFTAHVFYEGAPMGQISVNDASGRITVPMQLAETHLWEPGAGRLYDVKLQFGNDSVDSYFGLRSVQLDGYKFLINGKSVFQRLILDQGFYPDGIYTAPSDEALAHDIDMSMDMGFNGARLHEKVFEERFLYHCDRKGYLVWGEYPNWGLHHNRPEAIYSILPEWLEELERDQNHPAIVGWCPFNETTDVNGMRQHDDLLRMIYRTTKAVDPSRPCIDTSGWYHVETDIFDVHSYEQDPVTFRAQYESMPIDGTFYHRNEARQTYRGEAMFVSEFGGIRWAEGVGDVTRRTSWGYGKDVADYEEFKSRFKGLCDALLDNPCMFGFCYTQLTDVEQEQNGLYTYQREAKLDPAWVSQVVGRKAAIED